jgi:hypothetical protein
MEIANRRKPMKFNRLLMSSIGITLLIGALGAVSVEAAPPQQGPVTLTLQRVGTSSFA